MANYNRNILLLNLLMLVFSVNADNLKYNPSDVTTFAATGQCESCNLSGYTAIVSSSWTSAVNVSGSNITKAQFGTTGAGDWESANFSHVIGAYTKFNGLFYFANFNLSTFYSPQFKGVYSVATFNNENGMVNSNFSNTQIDEVQFQNTNLTNANFSNAKVDMADFTNANLTNANFYNASLTGANFSGATVTSTTNLRCANIFRATNVGFSETGSNTACMISEIGVQSSPPSGYSSCKQLCGA